MFIKNSLLNGLIYILVSAVSLSLSSQILQEVNKEKADGLNTEDFQYAIGRASDFSRYGWTGQSKY